MSHYLADAQQGQKPLKELLQSNQGDKMFLFVCFLTVLSPLLSKKSG